MLTTGLGPGHESMAQKDATEGGDNSVSRTLAAFM